MAKSELLPDVSPQFGLDSEHRELELQRGRTHSATRDMARYVTFGVGREVYGLSIRVIDQILKRSEVPTTGVPRTSDFLVGIGNVKGSVIPVINLARRIGLDEEILDRKARVLVVRHDGELHGIEVECVLGVCPIACDSIEPAPRAIGRRRGDFIEGLGSYEKTKVILLNLHALLDPKDFTLPKYTSSGKEL